MTVGSDIPYGVMEFYDDSGNPAGIDVDIAQEIASSLGVKLKFVRYDWDNLFAAVKNKEIDLAISSITITPEREREMLFSIPYFNGGQTILVSENGNEINGVIDLKGKKIGVQKETTGYAEALKYADVDLIVGYDNFDNSDVEGGILFDLDNKNIDAVIVDYIQAISIIKEKDGLKIVGEPFTQEYYGIATNKDNGDLMQEVDRVLREMKRQGGIKRIENNWVNN